MARDAAHPRAVAELLAAALCWSAGGLLIKWIPWPPLAVASGRGLLAALVLALATRGLRFTWTRVQVGAAVAYALCTIGFVVATKLTTAANAILLQYTAPIWIALFGASVLGERTTRSDWWAVGVTLAGMLLFFADSLRWSGVLGNLIGVASGISFAAMTLLMRKQKQGSVTESIILGNLIAGATGLFWLVEAPGLNASGWVALLALGVIQLGLSYMLYARAIKHVTALEAVLIPVIEPILNPVWVMLFVGERPGPLSLCGGLLVLGAVTWRAANSIRAARLPKMAL
ncbi:MAG TPA: DMT family transporter [Gemmatimonadales bacterium]|nr:DMT family transporter [Gemmatimonadales bacterium]